MTIRNKRALIFTAIIAVSSLSAGSGLRAGMDCGQSVKICKKQIGAIQGAINRAETAGNLKALQQLQRLLAEKKIECVERVGQACG